MRGFRIALLILLLGLLGAFLYLNRIGAPEFLRRAIADGIQEHGVEVALGRLRWHWYRGFVIEDVALGRSVGGQETSAQFGEVALDLDWPALLRRRQIALDALSFHDGRAVLPLDQPPGTARPLALDALQASVRFRPDGTWDLEELRGRWEGTPVRVSGVLTNGALAALRTREGLAGAEAPEPGAAPWQTPLREFAAIHRQLQFTQPPEIHLRFWGDVRDPATFGAELRGQAAGALSPWGRLQDFSLWARLRAAPGSNTWWRGEIRVEAAGAHSAVWGEFRKASVSLEAYPGGGVAEATGVGWQFRAEEVRGRLASVREIGVTGRSRRSAEFAAGWETDLEATATQLTTPWGTSGAAQGRIRVCHLWPEPRPEWVEGGVDLRQVQSQWGSAGRLEVRGRLSASEHAGPQGPDWTRWSAVRGGLQVQAEGVETPNLRLESATAAIAWHAPTLEITRLEAALYGGRLEVPEARLRTDDHVASARLMAQFDIHRLAPALGEGTERWLAQFGWETPPRLEAQVRAVLPAWDLPLADWGRATLPTLVVNGRVEGTNVSFQGVPIQSARVQGGLANEVLTLDALHVVRPEGTADLSYQLQVRTKEFRWRLRAALDPVTVGPIIDPGAPRVLREFAFGGPPEVAGEVWGCWEQPHWVACDVAVTITNFTFRGDRIDAVRGRVRWREPWLTAQEIELRAGGDYLGASGVGYDSAGDQVCLTNVTGRVDPGRVARAIGPELVKTFEPYQFGASPDVRVEGRVPTGSALDTADLQVEVRGGPFRYWRFRVPEVQGTVAWRGPRIVITNLVAAFYGGQLQADLRADLRTNGTADLQFRAEGTRLDARSLVEDTFPKTNRVEGELTGSLEILHANSADWKSWQGAGRVDLREGLIWDLPVFGVLSKGLNTVVPGLGNNRARAARATFVIRDSILYTEDLIVQAGPVNLEYRGSVDFDANVQARVEAEVLPRAPVIGPLLSFVFSPIAKVLVFKVTGTLGHPKLEPLYVPKVLLPLFRPFHTLRSVLPSDRSPTNAVPSGAPRESP
ncbi:MAG TPA: AsmA-like C-terminal region-containing protein [Verrucomicrobiota bacterium]|nr:AsmA-like C-terminal region-containing protein [Verrucomicrobiota bacterium]